MSGRHLLRSSILPTRTDLRNGAKALFLVKTPYFDKVAALSLYMKNILKELSLNWKSGLAVAIVSIPLSLSFAIASGAEPIMGLITSGWAGLAAAIFGGSKFNVISPAGAFAGILTAFSLQHGAEMIPIITILAGIMIVIAGRLKLARYLTFIPGGAIYGFTIGIGLIIAGTQIPSALGLLDVPAKESVLEFIIASLSQIGQADLIIVAIFAIFLAAMFVFKRLVPNISGVIMVAPLGLLLGFLSTKGIIPINLETLLSRYGTLESQIINMPNFTQLIYPALLSWEIVTPVLTIAAIGIIETMLSAKVADGITKTTHSREREMRGLGLANIVSGLVGGMPATGVLGPSVLNIQSGATSRYSAGIKAVLVLSITAVLFKFFAYLPMVVIASILFYVAISMIVSPQFMLYLRHDKASLVIALLVAFVTIYRDPASGIVLGSLIGLLVLAQNLSKEGYTATANLDNGVTKDVSREQDFSGVEGDVYLYTIQGVLTYLNSQAHLARLRTLDTDVRAVVLRMRDVSYIDLDGINALDQIIENLRDMDVEIAISSLPQNAIERVAQHSEYYSELKEQGMVFSKARFALEKFGIPLVDRIEE